MLNVNTLWCFQLFRTVFQNAQELGVESCLNAENTGQVCMLLALQGGLFWKEILKKASKPV